ncbi:sensor histidine kinase, partial [Streptococcus pneumoniae]|uniref:sensor histidine kinase n=1 Tax=Streptococcus pneumoniae TaxID=1313 RepID=UPI000AA50526
WLVGLTSHGYQVQVAVPKNFVLQGTVTSSANDMLDRLEKNIHDIYQLELSQKDANMRALQAQINPHFMYNTLEFLRMYAVMQSQDELADIIYEFSSLLRNNISDERETL